MVATQNSDRVGRFLVVRISWRANYGWGIIILEFRDSLFLWDVHKKCHIGWRVSKRLPGIQKMGIIGWVWERQVVGPAAFSRCSFPPKWWWVGSDGLPRNKS